MSGKTQKLVRTEDAPYLEVTLGSGKGNQYRLSLDIMSVGRGDDNDIVLPSEAISRCHFFLKKTPAHWLVQDNRSRNGVLLNGKKVAEAALTSGDRIQVGDFNFRFVDPKAAQALRANLRVEVPNPAPARAETARHRRSPRKSNGRDSVQVFYLAVGVGVGLALASFTAMRLGKGRRLAAHVPPALGNSRSEAIPTPDEVLRSAEARYPTASPAEPSREVAPGPAPEPISREELRVKSKGTRPRNDKADLVVYLKEGKDYLQEGDLESATMAFRFALVIDPHNQMASEGLRMIEERKSKGKTKTPAAPPAASFSESRRSKIDPAAEKRKQVNDLLKLAQAAFSRRSYQEAINTAERVRRIEIKNETLYLNEAKQIIDKAHFRQKEDVEPFLEQARQKLAAGDFRAGKDLCEEMVRMDPAYAEARDCVARAEEGLRTSGLKGFGARGADR